MKICDSLTQKLVNEKIITSEDRDIYEYGLECFLLKSIHMISYFLIALSTDKILEFFLFFIAYYPIRIYAGGYHANTRVGCYIFSCSQVFIVVNAISIMNTYFLGHKLSMVMLMVPAAICVILIMGLAPVDSVNKQLDAEEILCYQQRVYCLVCIEMLVLVVSLCFSIYIVYLPISVGFFCEVIMMILGKYKNKIQNFKVE